MPCRGAPCSAAHWVIVVRPRPHPHHPLAAQPIQPPPSAGQTPPLHLSRPIDPRLPPCLHPDSCSSSAHAAHRRSPRRPSNVCSASPALYACAGGALPPQSPLQTASRRHSACVSPCLCDSASSCRPPPNRVRTTRIRQSIAYCVVWTCETWRIVLPSSRPCAPPEAR